LPFPYPALRVALLGLPTIRKTAIEERQDSVASRHLIIGTGTALASLGGLAAAAITVGAPETSAPAETAAQTVETQTQVVTTVEHRTKRLKAHRSHRGHLVVAPAKAAADPTPVEVTDTTPSTPVAAPVQPAPAPTAPQDNSQGADDGPSHEVEDDHDESDSGSDDSSESADDSAPSGSGSDGARNGASSNDD
jgi:hypothetical protein